MTAGEAMKKYFINAIDKLLDGALEYGVISREDYEVLKRVIEKYKSS